MITDQDRKILKEVGREYLLDIALDSKLLKNKLTFKEHVKMCDMINTLTYKEVISLTITESIRDFESKFSKFLKYSMAAIAGMVWGTSLLTAPPVAMFTLYLFRKATDTCNLACIKKFPLSTQKKICKAECKVEGAKRIVNDLRSEVRKCGQFEKSAKCEKSLQKEYIKWSKRLQSLMVKLNQAKLGTELKARRAAASAQKKAKRLAASYQISNSRFIKMIAENSEIRKKIHFRDHIDLYHSILKEDDYEITPPKIDPKKEKMARQVLYLGLWVVPIPFFNDLINYLVKKYNFSCMTKCTQQNKYPHNVCYHQCSYLATKYAVGILNKNLKTCNKAKDPVKCKNKVYNLLNDWKQREVEAKIKFESSMRIELKKARTKNLKSMRQ